jgi:hypothetical protein
MGSIRLGLSIAALFVGGVCDYASATTIDFSDQAPVTNETGTLDSFSMSFDGVNENHTYSYSDGLSISFNGFGRNPEGYEYFDANNGTDPINGKIWSLSDNASIDFSRPVKVSSFWVWNYGGNYDNAPDDRYLFTVNGAGPDESFPETYQATTTDPFELNGESFWEVTGNGNFSFGDYAITHLDFGNFSNVFLDSLTFDPTVSTESITPEPSMAALLGIGAVGLLTGRRRRVRK